MRIKKNLLKVLYQLKVLWWWWITEIVFQPLLKYFTTPINNDRILPWKSKGLLEESIKPPATWDDTLVPKLSFIYNAKIVVEYKESCLKQEKGGFTHRNVVNPFFLRIRYMVKWFKHKVYTRWLGSEL